MAVEKTNVVDMIVEALLSKKGKDIAVMDLSGLSVFADYFVIATASSTPQANALIDAVDEAVRKVGIKGIRPQGDNSSPWILFDFGDVIVHIFLEEARDFYQLERLWSDAKIKRIAED